MHPYVRSLKSVLEQNANPANATPMKKYMRDQFEYLGIKTPQMSALHKDFVAEHGLSPVEELDVISKTSNVI